MIERGFSVQLGASGLQVSRLCFGTLPMSPLQANLTPEEGAELLVEAFHRGINFWDTAELYVNYLQLQLAIKNLQAIPVIATKTYADSKERARISLEKARRGLDLDVIPIFLLHEQESALTLKGHAAALDFLLNAREKGFIQAVGISSHTIAAIEAAIDFQDIDLIHPLINFRGLGIKDGSLEGMLDAVARAEQAGMGVYAMKVLGGGHLIRDAVRAVDFVQQLDFVHSMAIGMSSRDELDANLDLAQGRTLSPSLLDTLAQKKRTIVIEGWCSGCGSCVERCPQDALHLKQDVQRVQVDPSLCIFCGYCGVSCPEFCIKIF